MIQVVRAAIAATDPGGSTADYFATTGHWEGPLRHVFARLRGIASENQNGAKALALQAYEELNRRYHGTIYKEPDYSLLVEETFKALNQRAWWTRAPRLFETHRVDIGSIANVVPEVLRGIKQHEHEFTYVLLTKIFHFLLPDTFAIYDSRAAKSLETWEVMETGDPRRVNRSGLTYRADLLGVTSGKNYERIIRFYRRCWVLARTAKVDVKWCEAAGRMTELLRTFPCSETATVSPLDILDKLLYTAWGDAAKLGFGPAS